MNYQRELKKLGHIAVRGSYVGTADDRVDRWYLEHVEMPYVDRRGGGFTTLREAYNTASEREADENR